MGALIILSLILLGVVLVQIGKVNELSASIRGEEEAQESANRNHAIIGMGFMISFLVFVIASFIYYKDSMLGYGPLEAASIHGVEVDNIFNVTMVITGIVFFLTHIALFWYAYKYRGRAGHKAKFIPHDNRLEIIWMVIPSIAMAFLVIYGLAVWNMAMADIPENEVAGKDFIEIEANGQQFGWNLRYPGADNHLGATYYKLISSDNPFGQVWDDPKNHDDFQPSEIVLPVNKKVRVRITSRDVLHNFYLPHFRVKMDAVPGMPTYFVFTPTKTTEEFKEGLKGYPEWEKPTDPTDPSSNSRREDFNFELACAELCGNGHFSMKKLVKIVTEEEYQAWLTTQTSYYAANITGEVPEKVDTPAPVDAAPEVIKDEAEETTVIDAKVEEAVDDKKTVEEVIEKAVEEVVEPVEDGTTPK